ncbi:MAG: ArnT family glycosyltransferase [Vicinamibacterales bacterium]
MSEPASASRARSAGWRGTSLVIVIAAATWVGAAGLCWGTWSAGSADAHGYISQAELWLEGNLVVDAPMATTVPWDEAEWTFAPLGYRPGVEAGTIVPVYPAGLPLVMAGLEAVGGRDAVYLAVPIFGIIAVLATAWLAGRLDSPAAGAVAAVCLASSPTFLFSLMWPMSDVPAAALWMTAVALAAGPGVVSAAGAGVAMGLAVLTRPNLVLMTLAPAAYLLWRAWAARGGPYQRLALLRLGAAGVLACAGCVGVAAIHTWLYGSPLSTGYGNVTQIYAVDRLPEVATGFALRPLALEPALVLLCAIGLAWRLARRDAARPLAWMAAGAIALLGVSYAFYVTFPEWWYLRLLLPAWPPAAVFAGVGAASLARVAAGRWQTMAVAAMALIVAGLGLHEAVERGVFRLRGAEARYAAVSRFATRALPENAIFFAFQESGALHYYAGRPIIRFDTLPSRWFNDALSKMRTRGYRPYFVIEEPEEVVFKARFRPVSPLGYLDWPPIAELDGPVRVRIYDPGFRDRMRRGEQYPTFQITP